MNKECVADFSISFSDSGATATWHSSTGLSDLMRIFKQLVTVVVRSWQN